MKNKIDFNKTALIIIDVQNGFLNENTKYIPKKINRLVSTGLFKNIILTRFNNTYGSQYTRLIGWEGMIEAEEKEISTELNFHYNLVIDKDYYSICTNEFLKFVEDYKLDTFFLVGIDTDICVMKSASDLFELGFTPYVLTEFCESSAGHQYHDAAILILPRLIGENQIIDNFSKFFDLGDICD